MAGILAYLQYALGKLFYPIRGHDAKQITRSAAFAEIPSPNMILEASGCGASGSPMLEEHTCLAPDGLGKFPDLHWTAPDGLAMDSIKEYVLVNEDIDIPIPGLVIHHGLFYHIPPTTSTANHDDVTPAKVENGKKEYVTRAGWKYVENVMKLAYMGPAPPLGHGPHRYVFTIVALNEPLVFDEGEMVTKSKIKEAMRGKVVGWGQWVGLFERPWPK